jgi:endonuclease/exonuclease/phosphatase family metal-dependent hydrolase
MLNFVETYIRRLRGRLSRSEWLIRLLGLPKSRDEPSAPGLVLIQIDGLSRHQLERAMAQGNMPFLRQLLARHRYRLHSLYSGMPSSTPAVTAEVFYGVKTAVPAFSFFDRQRSRVFRMYSPEAAKEIEQRLQEQGEPLLTGGSTYASIYTGGAAERHLCAASVEWSDLFKVGRPLRMVLLFVLNFYSAIRALVLLGVELILAIWDCVAGTIAGRDLWKEIKFIPSRVGVSILMRELSTIGAKMDVTRGLPIVYLDFVGYDEQSHRRGPTSRFAHWSLQGIDDAISRVWKAAQRSSRRDYDVWVFSDHGNEDTPSYVHEHGRTIQEVVAELFDAVVARLPDHRGVQSKRMSAYMSRRFREAKPVESGHVVVTSMGPTGSVYLDKPIDAEQRMRMAKMLVDRAQVPLVLIPDGPGRARAWTKERSFVLPEEGEALFGPDHPFREEMVEDLVALCHHPNAGDFVISGWSRTGPCITFPVEGGSHAGPGAEEIHAFVLAPDDAPLPDRPQGYLRPLSLREAAMAHLGRGAPQRSVPAPVAEDGILRVMTYNVHTCVGIDGKLSPRRIARVIARYQPDVVALQEVDVGRLRTGGADQAELIAHLLEMQYHFHPAIHLEEERYGDCILSRLPMRLIKAGALPSPVTGRFVEPRGALWVALDIGGRTIHVVNTHLGLTAGEKQMQIEVLLGPEWIGGNGHAEPFVFCGDFNSSPRSRIWRLCTQRLRDAQTEATSHVPRGTWFGHIPFARIDHVFVSPEIEVLRVDVGDDHLARAASDHRPLFVELRIGPRQEK